MKKMMVFLVVFFAVGDCMAQKILVCTKLKNTNDTICVVRDCAKTPMGCNANGIMESFNNTLLSKKADSLSNPKVIPVDLQKILELLLPKVDIMIVNGKGNRQSLRVISRIDNAQIYEKVFNTSANGLKKIVPKKATTSIKNAESYTVKIDVNNIRNAAKAAFDQLSFELVE